MGANATVLHCTSHPQRQRSGRKTRPVIARFGPRMASELARLAHWASAPPTKGEVATWYARMCHLIAQHKNRKDEAGRFALHLGVEMGSLWVFLIEEGVDPTNNRAKRALRFAVRWRRMMQGSITDKGDRWSEHMLYLRETCRLRGLPTYPILVEALTCSFNNTTPDVSWI